MTEDESAVQEAIATSGTEPVARFRRATPRDALELATATHLAGKRVDMGTLARELGIARATLYRWFGSREILLEQVLLERIEVFVALIREHARGQGEQRVGEIVRGIVDASLSATPVRAFIEREPTLALRILAGEHGGIHQYLVRETVAELSAMRPELDRTALEARVDAVTQMTTALLWVSIAIGDEPPTERLLTIVRELLGFAPTATGAGAGAGS